MGGIIPTILGRDGDFQGLGLCPLLGLLTVPWKVPIMTLLCVPFSLLTEDQGPVEVDLFALLDSFHSNVLLLKILF